MADDEATFAERFTGEPPPPAPSPAPLLSKDQTFASPQYAAEYAKQQFKAGNYGRYAAGIAGYLAASSVDTLINLFTAPHEAAAGHLTPDQQIDYAANQALVEVLGPVVAGKDQFKTPKGTADAFDQFHEQVIKPVAQQFTSPPSEPEPPQNTPVPPMVPRSRLALTGEPHVDAVLNSPITKDVIDNPVVDRTHDVPYGAGGSVPLQDPTMFIDKHFPHAFTIDGKSFDPAEPFAIHENVEQHTMGILEDGGMDHEAAYKVAHFEFAEKAEGAWYRTHGIDQAKAEAAYKPYLDAIQRETPTDIPPNLFKDPYPHDRPFAAQDEAFGEPRPTAEEIDRAKRIINDWQAKQPAIYGFHGTAAEVDFGANFDVMEGGNKSEHGVSFFGVRPETADVYTSTNARARARVDAAITKQIDFEKEMKEKYGTTEWRPKATMDERKEWMRLSDATQAARNPPEGAPGPRIIPVRISPGKTETFDVAKLFGENDKEFLDAFRETYTNPDIGAAPPIYKQYTPEERNSRFEERLKELQARYRDHEKTRARILEETKDEEGGPRDIGPWEGPLDLIAPAVYLAKKHGLDTARITNLAEHGEQILVLNKDQISPRYTSPLQEAHELGVIGAPREPVPTDSPAVAAQRAIPANMKQGDKITMTPAGEPIDAWEKRFNDWVDRVKEPDDVKPFIHDAAAQNNNFADARAGEVSPAHIEVLADAAGIDPAKVDRTYFKQFFDNPDKVRMAKEAMDQALSKFKEASAKVENDPSPANVAAMLEAEIRRDYIIEQMMGLRAEWGKTGHALRDLLEAGKGAPSTGLAGEIKEKIKPPKTVVDTIDAARDFTKKAAQAKEGDELGLDKLIKQAQALVDENKPKKPGEKAPELPPDVKELVKTANAVVNLMKAPKEAERVNTVRPLPQLIREGEAAPKNALAGFNALVTEAQRNVTQGLKEGKTVRQAMPKELRDMVEAAENVTSHFGGTGIQRAVQDLLARKGRTPEDMQTIARSMRGLTNEQASRILSDMRGKQQPWYYWVWQQGLISGEVTHTKYVTVNYGFATLDRTLAPGIAAIIGKLHGGEKVFFGEPVVAMYHLIRGVPDALRASVAAFKSGLRVPLAEEMQLADRATARGERVPRDLLHTQQVPYGQPGAPDWGIWQRVLNDKQLGTATSVLGFPGRSASAIHAFFKNLSVDASKHARAYRAAAEEGLNPLSKEFNDRYAYHLANPTDEALRGAVQDGYSGTFMDKLGPMEERLAAAVRDTPWKWVFPFLHIPINIVRQTVKYSPMAWLNKDMRADLTGANGHVAQDLAISKMVIGSSVMGYFIHQALMGNATGDYPTDPKERKEWQLMGKIPNAVQYNGQWYQMQRFGPPGNLAMIGADIGAIIRHYDNHDDDTMLNVIGHSMLATINLLANETGFMSLQNLFDVFEGKQSVAQYVAYQAGTFVPFSSLLYQTASLLDPEARQAKTLIDGLKARVPFLREQILPRRDPLYGEPAPNPGYGSPFRGVPVQQDFVKQELDRLGYYPSAPEAKIGGVKLTPEQFDKYEATAGPLVKAALNGLIRSPQWQAHNGNPEWQKTIAKQVISSARAKARGAMQLDDHSLIEAGRQRRLTQINGPQ